MKPASVLLRMERSCVHFGLLGEWCDLSVLSKDFPFTLKHLTGSFSQCVAERNGFIYKHRLRIASFLERRPSAQGAVFIQIVRLAVNANYTTDLLS